MEFLDSNGRLPSGKNGINLLSFVLDKMWEQKSAATKSIDVNTLKILTNTVDAGDHVRKLPTALFRPFKG